MISIEDIRIWSESADWLQIVLSLAVIGIPSLAIAYITLFASEKTVKVLRKLVNSFRTFVDEPTDPVVKELAERLGLTPKQVVDMLALLLNNLALPARDMTRIDITNSEPRSPQEINIGGVIK